MSLSDLYPDIRPSLLLDFANTKALDPRITFSRASAAKYYDGVTFAKAEENLLTYSQEFDSAAWNKGNSTITANDTTAPDGTTTADKITRVGTSLSNVSQPKTAIAAPYVASVFAKAGTQNFLAIQINTNGTTRASFITFDLTNGSIGTEQTLTTNVGLTGTATDVGNGWYRCSVAYTSLGGSDNILFNASGTANSRDGTDGGTIYIWGAQLEQRSALTDYTPTTTQPITNYVPALQSAAAGEARFDHDPVTGESKGLLIEEQRTNLLLRSEEFDATWFTQRASVISNIVISPDGALSADKVVIDSTNAANHNISQSVSVTSGITYTFSVYAKAAEINQINLRFSAQFPSGNSFFDLSSGIVSNAGAVDNSTITAVGNGWYRCSFTQTASATGTAAAQVFLTDGGSITIATGDGYSGVYVWGAQLEAGSFPTSYITTTSATATRNSDSASMTGTNFSEWYRQDEGSWYSDCSVDRVVTLGATGAFFAEGSDETNHMRTFYRANGASGINVTKNSVTRADISPTGVLAASENLVVAFGYAFNDFAGSGNGGSVITDSSVEVPYLQLVRIGRGSPTSGILNGHIKKLAYYPARLTNAQLQNLTKG